MIIKALSVRQPYASLIATGTKTIETRSRNTKYRGSLVICSTAKPTIGITGMALCIVDLVDVVLMSRKYLTAACLDSVGFQYGWVLENIREIKSFPVKGNLGIYNIDIKNSLMTTGADLVEEVQG